MSNMTVYTLDQVAEVLGVSVPTVRRFVKSGQLRAARLGWRTLRFSDEAVRDFLKSMEQTGGVASSGGTRKRTSPLSRGPGEGKQIRKVTEGRSTHKRT